MTTNQTKMTQENLNTVRQFFSEDEWNAIYDALGEYQDQGDDEAVIVDNIHHKINQLFNN